MPQPKKKSLSPNKFTLDYINSPKYKERLIKQGYDNPQEVINKRSSMVNITHTINQDGKPNLLKQLQLKLQNIPYSMQGSLYDPSTSSIIMNYPTDSEKKLNRGIGYNGIKSHEIAHAEQAGYPLNKKDSDELFNRQKAFQVDEDFRKQDRDNFNRNKVPHDFKPDENKADINALRYLLKNNNIYDAGKEDFKKEHLDKIKSNFIKDRLLKNYSENDLIWLMNNIASNNNVSNINVAAQGGYINQPSIPQTMNTNNKQLISQFRLPSYIAGKSFADASKLISSKFEGRNDMISVKTKHELLKRLSQAQEYLKSQEEQVQQEQMALGGFADSTIGQGFGEDATAEQKNAALGAGLGIATTGLDLGMTAFGKPVQDTSGLTASAPVDSVGMIGGSALKGASAGMAFGPLGAGIGAVVGAGAGLLGTNKAKKAALENSNNFAINTNKQFSDNYALGGEINPVKKVTVNELTNKIIIPNSKPNSQSDRFRYAVGEQSGVQHGTSGEKGYYLYYGKKPGDNGFNPTIHREFVNEQGYNTYMKSPQGQQYRQNLANQTIQPIEQFDKGGYYDKNNPYFMTNPGSVITPNTTTPTLGLVNELKPAELTYNIKPTTTKLNIPKITEGPSNIDIAKFYAKKTGDKISNNSDLLRYAPAVMNAYQLSQLKKPEGVRLDRLDNRYKPDYVDLAQQQNIVNQELNNTTSAIQQSGASEGASRAAILGAQLNKTRALSGAYTNAQQQNAQQNAIAQNFNLGVDQANIGQSNTEQEINDKNKGAYDTQKSQLLSQIGNDLGNIGKEQLFKQYPKMMGLGYNWNGKYFINDKGDIKTKEDAEAVEKTQKSKGGYLNQDVLNHINNMYTKRNSK